MIFCRNLASERLFASRPSSRFFPHFHRASRLLSSLSSWRYIVDLVQWSLIFFLDPGNGLLTMNPQLEALLYDSTRPIVSFYLSPDSLSVLLSSVSSSSSRYRRRLDQRRSPVAVVGHHEGINGVGCRK